MTVPDTQSDHPATTRDEIDSSDLTMLGAAALAGPGVETGVRRVLSDIVLMIEDHSASLQETTPTAPADER